jgi:type II secretory pathway component PulK
MRQGSGLRVGRTAFRSRHGMVLIVVLVVITLLALGALTFSELMMAEREGAEVAVVQSQTRALAESGVEMARLFLAQDAQTQQQAGGWFNNSSRFQAVAVVPEGVHGVGRVTIVASNLDQNGNVAGIRFGLEDESARLNLNAVLAIDQKNQGKDIARQMLMALPNMTDESIADAILDWMDLDDEPREYGAEIDAYAGMGYATKNGPLDTIEELLLVRGVTPQLLFGLDTNRNYLVDKSESSSGTAVNSSNSDGSINLGWAPYLTIYSKESNQSSSGQAKIDLTQSDLKTLYNSLESAIGQDWATFIVAFRQSSGYTKKGSTTNRKTISPSQYQIDFEQKAGSAKLTTVLDLIAEDNQELVVRSGGQQVALESPFPNAPLLSSTFLPKLLDNCTVGSSGTTIPRVNVNLASKPVLAAVLTAALSGGDQSSTSPSTGSSTNSSTDSSTDSNEIEEIASQIISQRPQDPTNQSDDTFKYETWMYSKLFVTLDQMKKLMPYVCASGSVYRAQAIGYFDKGGPAARIEFVIDATSSPPRIVFWRDMTNLGRGYPLETLGVQADSQTSSTSP